MEGFADIHTHILPGVDDGAKSMESAMTMLDYAYCQGTRTLFLTPHYRGNYRAVTPSQRQAVFRMLERAAADRYADLTLHLGCEIAWERGVGEKLRSGEILSYAGGDYALLEFREDAGERSVLDGVEDVLSAGFIPVLAHVERVAAFRRGLSLARRTASLGALLQMNADSVMGRWGGFWVKRCCARLLKAGLVSFIASDAHDTLHRPPVLDGCYDYVASTWGQEYAAGLFWENARLLVPEK